MPAPAADPWQHRIDAALGMAQRGALAEAAAALAALCGERPRNALPHILLATVRHRLGEHDEALRELDAAASLSPGDPQVPAMRPRLLLAAGRAVDAEAAARRVLASAPDDPHAQFDLACALQAQQRWDESGAACAALLERHPGHVAARHLLSRSLLMRGDADGALAQARHPALLDDPATAFAVAADFGARDAQAQRAALLCALAARHPQDYACAIASADALLAANRAGEALAQAQRAGSLRPQASRPRQLRAAALIERGDTQPGLALFRGLFEQGGLDAADAQKYLIALHYDSEQQPQPMYAAHAAWAARHAQPFAPPFVAQPETERKLRVGWLSPRFNEGPVARFLTGTLRAFDREHYHHLLLELHGLRDACTDAFEAISDETVALHGLDDETLLARLRGLRLDVLVDLAGHAPFGRPRVLAQRVAPVQLSWLDWFDTTGLPNMDGWIGDRWLNPPDSPQRFSETVLRLGGGRFCYTPPDHAPQPQREGGGAPVLVSFNRTAKLNDRVIDAWARILAAVPDARLLLGDRAFDDGDAREYMRGRFAARGIAAQRIELQGHVDYAALLSAYRRADIALDPFPFSGCTTSCDALWMGVPVVTLPGWSVASRQTASLLWRLGREQWVARDADDYVARAAALAGEVGSLRVQRASLRDEVAGKLSDAAGQAAEFAALLAGLAGGRDAGVDRPR